MGYECPVCGTEEADGEHLANHVAFTALVRGGDHEDWLDDHVPDWGDRDPDSLASEVTPHATETETEPVTESHDGAPERHELDAPSAGRFEGMQGKAGTDLSGEAADVLAEARALTEQMYEDDAEESEDLERSGASEESPNSENE